MDLVKAIENVGTPNGTPKQSVDVTASGTVEE